MTHVRQSKQKLIVDNLNRQDSCFLQDFFENKPSDIENINMTILLTMHKMNSMNLIGICFIVVLVNGRPAPVQKTEDISFEANLTTSNEYIPRFTSYPYYRIYANTPRTNEDIMNDYTTEALKADYFEPYKQFKMMSTKLFDYNEFKLGIPNYSTDNNDPVDFFNFLKSTTESNLEDIFENKNFNTVQLEDFLNIIKKKAMENLYMQQPTTTRKPFEKRSAAKASNETEDAKKKCGVVKHMYNKIFRSSKKNDKKDKLDKEKNITDKQDSKKKKSKCGKCGVRRSTVRSTTESPATEYTTVKDSSTEEMVSENDRATTQNNEVDVKIATEEEGDSYAPSPMKSENTDSGSQNLTLPRQSSDKNKHSKNAKNRDSNKKHMRHIPLKHITSPSERFLYKRQLPEVDYENTVKILPKQDITVNNITNFQMDSDSSADLRSPFINAALKNGTTEALDLGTLTQKLHYTDYINGYKYYLNYQRELGKEKFSDLVKYQAHRHHNVDDIGKFILDKLPPIPTMNRYKRDFLVDDSMDDQDLSTRSDDTWFKKHFYLFINTAPTKNVQSESFVEQTKAPLQQLSAKPQRDNLNTIVFDDTSPSYRRDERSIDHNSALLGSDTSFLTGASVSPDAVIPRNRRDSGVDQSKDNKKKIEETNPKPRLSSENKRTLKHKGFFRKFYHHKKNDNNKINNDRPLRRSYRFIGLKNLKNLLYDSKMRNPVLNKPTYMDYLMRSSNEPKTNDGKFIRNKNKYNIPNADYLKSQVPNITGMAPNEVNAKQVQGSEKYSLNDKSMEDKSLQNTNSPSQYPSYPSASPLMTDQPSSYPDMPISMKNPLDHPSAGSPLDFHPKDFSNMPDKLDLGEVPYDSRTADSTLKSMTAEPDAMTFEDTTYSKEYTVTEDLAASTSELWSMTKSTIEMFQYTEPSTTFSTYPTMETDNMHGNSIEGYGSVEDVNTYNNNLTSITTEAWSRRPEIKDEPSLVTNSEAAANNMGPELITDGASNEMLSFDRLIAASLEPWKRARAYKYRHTRPSNNVLTTGSKTIRRVSGGNKRNSNRGYVFFDTTLLSYDDGVDLITESLGLSAPRPGILGHKSSSSRIEVHSTPPKQFYTTPIPMKGNEFNKFLKDNNLEVTPLTNSVGTYSIATEAYAKVNEQLSAKPTKIIKMDKAVTHTKNIKSNLYDNVNVFRNNDSLENNKADNSYTRMNQNYESYKRSPYDFFESKEKYPSYTVTDSKMKDNAIKIVNYPVNEDLLSMHSTRKVAYMDEIDKNLDMNVKGMHDVIHGIHYPKVENTQFNLEEDFDATTISMNKLKKHVKDIPYGNEYEMSRSTPFISMAKEGKAHSKPNEVAIRNHVYKFDIVLSDASPGKALADDSNIYSDHIINRKQRRWKRKSKRHRRFGTALFSFWGKQPKESVNSKTTSDKNTSPTTSTARASGKPSRNVDAVNVKDKSKSIPVSDNNTMILLESNDVTTNPPGDVDEMISRSTKAVMDKLYGNKNKSATNNVSIFRKLLTADIKIDKDINLDDIENMEKELNVKQSLFRSVDPKLKLEAKKSEIKPIEQKTVTIPVKLVITKKKLPKNHKVKRTASFTTFTAKDVSELELVIDVQKKSESADVDKNKKRDLHLIVNSLSENKPVKKQIGLEPVNLSSSKVYIVVTDSPNTGSKSLNEPVKQRKVLSAIMSTPVDILYQIHAYDNISQEPYVFNTQSATEISNGIYLIIQRGGKIVLNPVQEITEPYSTQAHYTSTEIVKAKDIVYAVEEKLNKIYDIIMTNNNQYHNVRARAAKFFTMPKVTSPMRTRKDDDYGISSTFRNLNENQFTTESDELSYTDFVPVTQPKKYNINIIGTVIKVSDATTESKPVTNSQSTKKLLPELMDLSSIYSKNITEKHKIMSTPKFTSILSADSKSPKDDESNLYPKMSISKMSKTEQIADKDVKNKLESIIDKLSSVTKDIFEHSLEINDAVLDFSEQATKSQTTMTLKKLNITEPAVFYIPSSSTPATIFSTFANITNKDDILERLDTLTSTGISVTNQPIDNVASKGKLQNVMNALLTYNKDKSKIPISTVKTTKPASTTKKPKKNETKKKGKDEKLNSVQRVGPDNKRKLVTKSKMKMTSGKMTLDGAGQTILKKEKTSTTKAPIVTTTAISFPTEAPQSVPGNLNMVCDLPATYRNIELLHEKLPRQEFANIMKHMNCSRYKEPPRFFLLTCKKKKILKEQINKQRKFMKHLKWDWIREKRSVSVTTSGDSFDANDYSSGQYNLFKVYLEQDNDFFEEFVKDRHGIFRGKCNERKKRKSSKDPDKTDELYIYYGDTVIIDCMTMPGIPKPGKSNDFTILWETEDKELTETDNSGVLGSLLVIEDTNPKNDGIYLCKSKGVIKRIKVTVVALPVLNIIFTPLYAAKEKCSDILMDVIALKKFESDMETYVCPSKKHCNITIHKPFCFTDRLSNASHLKAMIVVTLRPPTLACNTECKRDLYAGLCNLTIANIPLILKTPLILSSYEGNITLKPVPKEDISGGVAHALIREAEPVSNKHLNFAVKMHPGDIQTIFTCSAGYFLIPQENICASCPRNTSSTVGQNICLACPVGSWAPPGAASCIRIIKNGRCSHWWFNPSLTMHYVLTSLLVTTACACCVAAVSRRRRGDSRTISPRRDLETGQQKTATTADNMPGLNQLCYSATCYKNKSRPLSPSRVILARLFSSPPRSRDDSQNKFEIWKERNSRPPVPPVDFDY